MPMMLMAIAVVAVFYGMAAVISWRLYATLFLLPQLLLTLLWLRHCNEVSRPGYQGGPGEGFGVALVMLVHLSLALGGLLAGALVALARGLMRADTTPSTAGSERDAAS